MRASVAALVVVTTAVALSACSPPASTTVVVGYQDGQLRIAVLRCIKPGADRVILETVRPGTDDRGPLRTRVGEWSTPDDRHAMVTINPHAPTGWTTESAWSGPDEGVELYRATTEGGQGHSQPVDFSMAEAEALEAGEWLHVVSYGDAQLEGLENEIVRDLPSFRRSWCADHVW